MSTREVIVATIGRAHGLRGEVALRLRTDQPEERLLEGTVFALPDGRGLTLTGVRAQQDRWYVRFAEVADRTAAEALRGADLAVEVDEEVEADEDPDAWYPSQLTGLAVHHVDGRELGTVVGVEHYPAQDLLTVRTGDGRRVQLPLVEQLVPEVDLEAGRILADPPGGLFEDLPDDDADEADEADEADDAGDTADDRPGQG